MIRTSRPTAMTGASHPAGATPIGMPPPGPNSLDKRGVSRLLREPLAGNHRANSPRHPRASPGMVSAVQTREPARGAGRIPCRILPCKRDAGGSNPPAPTTFVQLDGFFRTLIGD